MRILHVITRLIVGGAQENTLLTCKGLVARGHEVMLAAGTQTGPEGSLWGQAQAAGCELVRLAHMKRAVHPVLDSRARRELTRVVRAFCPDVVHTHSSKAGILGRSAAARCHTPVIVHTIHGMSFNRTQPALVRALYSFLERRAGRVTDGFIAVADAMVEQAVAAGIAPQDRFVTIRSGMEVERFQCDASTRQAVRSSWKVGQEDLVIGTIARLFDHKGYDEIIEAMPSIVARAPSARFVWVGDGARRGEYQDRLRRAKLDDRVVLLGLIAPEEVPRAACGFDVVLHASRWEGLPRAVVQGALCGVPAVCFANDGAVEVVADGVSGRLVVDGNVPALADAVVELATNPALRAAMGAEGRRRCLGAFDGNVMVERIEALYRRIWKEKFGADNERGRVPRA